MSTPASRNVQYPRGSGRPPRPAEAACSPTDTKACPPTDTFTLEVCPDAKTQAKRSRREQAEQITYFDQVRACLRVDPVTGIATPIPGREGADLIFALANENAAGKGIGIVRWKMGVKAGLQDIAIFVPRNGYHAAFIELKQSGGVASDVRPTQRDCQEKLNAQGYRAVVSFGWYEAWKLTCDYLGWDHH